MATKTVSRKEVLESVVKRTNSRIRRLGDRIEAGRSSNADRDQAEIDTLKSELVVLNELASEQA